MIRIQISSHLKWHLHHTARAFERRGVLSGYWVSNANISGVSSSLYHRVWPYHLLKKPFYHLPFPQLDEWSRWWVLWAYDAWVQRQVLQKNCNVVMGPMGACTPIFQLARKTSRSILRVCEAPNSHPIHYSETWQRECDQFAPGYRIPHPHWAVRRASLELEQADLVLCPSQFVRDTMVGHGVAAEKCVIRHFGVDTSLFRPRHVIPAEPVFVCVGSITVRKGHPYLLRAFASFKQQFPAARLICVGGIRPDMDKEWRQWSHLVEHHPFLSQEQIADRLAQATAFILPSIEEGFARVLSEAMAAGLPIIATHESGITTIAEHGISAWIIPSRSTEAIVDAMHQLHTDASLNRRVAEHALEIGRAKNTWQDYADDLIEMISTFVSRDFPKSVDPETVHKNRES